MQSFRIPYTTDKAGSELIANIRRVQSSVLRSAYSMAHAEDGTVRPQKIVCQMMKDRFSKEEVLDSWAIHCATKLAFTKRKLVPDGSLIFGGKKTLQRRNKDLITNEEWKQKRLHPFVSYGDSQKGYGNQNVKLLDKNTLLVRISRFVDNKIKIDDAVLHLGELTGNAGYIVRTVADLCNAEDQKHRINVTYQIDEKYIYITVDPEYLQFHPERRVPVRAIKGRCLGIDMNPNFVGISVVANYKNSTKLSMTELLEHQLVQFDLAKDVSRETVRETLAGMCDRIIRLCRKWGVGLIAVEKGLGKLRSRGKNKNNNRLLNYWARTILINMLTRKAALAGIKVVQVWSGYSTTIGNLWFDAPDACAAAAEVGRRGLALNAKKKDVLPAYEEGWRHGLWKDLSLPVEGVCWRDVHQAIKSAKLGYRRPHPAIPVSDIPTGANVSDGYAVRRLKHRHRPGIIFLTNGRVENEASIRSRGGVSAYG